MPPAIDHYQVLNLPRDAGSDEIHQAYRALARACHPDMNPGPDAAAHMALVNEAYECLAEPGRRRQYDRSLTVTEPLSLRRAVLDAAAAQLTRPGWRRAEIGAGDSIFEGQRQRVFARFVPTLGSVELESWVRAARRAFRRNTAGHAVVLAYRVLVTEDVPRAALGGKMPATAIDLIEGRRLGCAFSDASVEELFSPLLIE